MPGAGSFLTGADSDLGAGVVQHRRNRQEAMVALYSALAASARLAEILRMLMLMPHGGGLHAENQ